MGELSTRLNRALPREVVERATAENGWFTREDIVRAVEAIRLDMLSPDKLQEWLAHYPTTPRQEAKNVLIIMAGNIPLVGFFDLLCVVASGHRAYIKPSSKDSVLMGWIISEILDIEPSTPIYIYDNQTIEYLIATGGEAAERVFYHRYTNTPKIIRGSRHSIAVLSASDKIEEIEEDIYAYSGLGCRNVSMIFVPKGYAINMRRVETNPKYTANYLHTKAILAMQGKTFYDSGSSLFIESHDFPHALSAISIYEYDDIAHVEEWIARNDSKLQCILSRLISHPRCVGFGTSQRPTLFDYADGVDTMAFLTTNNMI